MSAGKGDKSRRFNPDRDVEEWHGAYVPYDILKEALVALLVVGVLIVGLTIIFSSPDEHPVTLKSWSANDPVDFAQTAITELDGTSAVATYGPPYNATPGQLPVDRPLLAARSGSGCPSREHGPGLRDRSTGDPAQPTRAHRCPQSLHLGPIVGASDVDRRL